MRRHVNAVGHHDDDVASVLGTVQGSALRSDRAGPPQRGCRVGGPGMGGLRALTVPARRPPSWQLRDGRRVLFRPEHMAH